LGSCKSPEINFWQNSGNPGQAVLTYKVCQTDIVFGACDEGVSVGLHARSEVTVCNGYDLCHSG